MYGFNYADVFEAIAAVQPERPAVVQGSHTLRWVDLDRRADALAAALLGAGLGRQAKVAVYLYNSPEYLETYLAAFKIGLSPFNVNYRYGSEELFYLLDNADAEAVILHASFAKTLEGITARLPKIKIFLVVAEEDDATPTWARDYEATVSLHKRGPVRAPWGRSGDDLLLLYTGGTTGMPKGVMWRQDELFRGLGQGGNVLAGLPPIDSLADIVVRMTDPAHARPVGLAASPLMHGTGQFGALGTLTQGGVVALLASRKFNAEELWSDVERLRITRIGIVGSAFSTPMLEVLDANPGRWDLTSVRFIGSSGSMWGQANKEGLLKHLPGCVLADSFASSEALGMGSSLSASTASAETARFVLGPNAAVFSDDGRRVIPGSGERGMVAVGGRLPDGYYKDPAKSAKTFPIIEGRRWCVPGDWASVNEDGTLNLLGRGSVCINTGGEKVFPEEVEEALKQHPAVRDAVVVGLPDERFGERICAVVELKDGAPPFDLAKASEHVTRRLAAYKAPRDIVVVGSVGRAANGKVDYKAIKDLAAAALDAAPDITPSATAQ